MAKTCFEIADTVETNDTLYIEVNRGKLYVSVSEAGHRSDMVTDNLDDIAKLRDALTELIEEQQSNG